MKPLKLKTVILIASGLMSQITFAGTDSSQDLYLATQDFFQISSHLKLDETILQIQSEITTTRKQVVSLTTRSDRSETLAGFGIGGLFSGLAFSHESSHGRKDSTTWVAKDPDRTLQESQQAVLDNQQMQASLKNYLKNNLSEIRAMKFALAKALKLSLNLKDADFMSYLPTLDLMMTRSSVIQVSASQRITRCEVLKYANTKYSSSYSKSVFDLGISFFVGGGLSGSAGNGHSYYEEVKHAYDDKKCNDSTSVTTLDVNEVLQFELKLAEKIIAAYAKQVSIKLLTIKTPSIETLGFGFPN